PKCEQVKELLHLIRDELDEFQASSQELEEELEMELQRTERAQQELDDQGRRLEVDRDNWQAKFIQSNELVNKLQLELTAVCQTIVTYMSQVVELEMGNDDLERNERAAAESLKELESQLKRMMEEKILLEGDVVKKTLSEENQRLRDANSERENSFETQNLPNARGVTSSCGDMLSNFHRRISNAPGFTRSCGDQLSNLHHRFKSRGTSRLGAQGSPTFANDFHSCLFDLFPPSSTPAKSAATVIILDCYSPPRSSLSRPPLSRGLSMVNDMRNKTRRFRQR
ncbi:NADH:ubiquinone oxidoreductase, partial [Tulasnella sp. UAMH 9824]